MHLLQALWDFPSASLSVAAHSGARKGRSHLSLVLLLAIALFWPAQATAQGPVSDDFHSTSLNTNLWTFVNPLGDATLTMDGTNAVVSVPGGVNHELWTNKTTAPRLMQAVANVDFQVEVKFNSGLAFQTNGSQEQGIMVQQDTQNYIRFALFSGSSSSYVYVATFAAGQPTTQVYSAISLANKQVPLWMRVQRSSNTWTMSWSSDGSTYTTGATFTYAMTVAQIGPYAGNSGNSYTKTPAPAFTASFDYFFNTASPIVPEDGAVDITPTSVMASPTATGATVSWNTADWSTSRVDYGPSTSYGATLSSPTLVTSHSLIISGLTCATTYHYSVTSADSSGSSMSSPDATFTTAACSSTGPIISNVAVTPLATSATVAWTTNVAATSKVNYGTTSAYGMTVGDATLVTTHSLSLSNLTCNTQYHYQIISTDSTGNTSATPDSTFLTVACGGPVSDDFHGSSLNTSLWTLVAPCCGSVRMNGTDALLVVPAVTNHDIWTYGDRAVRLMQNVSNTDFEVVAKFDSPVTVVGQLEGMVIEQDSQNLIRVDVSWSSTQTKLYVATFAAMVPTTQYFNAVAIPYGTAPLWIKVKRVGNNWTQSWSIDGVNFNVGAVFSYSLNVTRLGPYAGTNGNTSTGTPAPNFTAAVDYFFNTASPVSPADGGMAQPANQPLINVWYGDTQNFGQNGTPQTWVNILGNVSAPAGIKSLTYSLNGGAEQFLRVGPNNARLVDIGDFNVEIDHASLVAGANTVRITATDNNGVQAIHNVTINYTAGKTWPLPYSIDWSTVTNIQDVAQIVDGLWAIQPDGTVRTLQTGYDRVIAIGDMSWTDYVVTSEITINALDCYAFGAGLVVGWTGHTTDPNMPQPDQPRTGHPFFGLGWYATTGTERAPNAQLNIYANSTNFPETVLAQDTSGWKPVLGLKYIFKFQVTRNSNGTSHFALKVWPANTTEPSTWNLQANGDPSNGSVLLGAYQADMSFGRITISPLP